MTFYMCLHVSITLMLMKIACNDSLLNHVSFLQSPDDILKRILVFVVLKDNPQAGSDMAEIKARSIIYRRRTSDGLIVSLINVLTVRSDSTVDIGFSLSSLSFFSTL